jgi:transposase
MSKIHKNHGSGFKAKVALEAIKENKTTAEMCQQFSIATSQIYAWKKQLEEGAPSLFEDKRKKDNNQEEIDRLHRVIGQLTAERDFLDRVLKR